MRGSKKRIGHIDHQVGNDEHGGEDENEPLQRGVIAVERRVPRKEPNSRPAMHDFHKHRPNEEMANQHDSAKGDHRNKRVPQCML